MCSEQKFGDYVMFDKLATAAFGDSFRAGRVLGNVVETHVLLQLFNGASLDTDPFWQLVADRRSLAEDLKDPHLGDSLVFDRAGPTPFATYSYSPGRSLDVFLTAVRDQKLPVPIDQALFIIERAALGLTAAHEVIHRGRPVLHGFLVPELIRLSSEGEIRVLGIEAAPGLRSQLATHPAFMPYLAPEVRAGEPPGETDDVFSLGALLYHLLCGVAIAPDSSESMAETIDNATLTAGSEPMPPVIKNLLKNSLAPRAKRIQNAVTWQQVLGKIILDGEHNPTTFNLSFLMHTIFRQDLEAELAKAPQELGLRLSPAATVSSDDEEETAAALLTPPPDQTRRPFLTGFMLSFCSAAIIIASYFVFFHTPGEADTGDLLSPPPAIAMAMPSGDALADDINDQRGDSTLPQDPTSSDATESAEPIADGDPDETPREETEPQLQELRSRPAEDLEATLRAEYEARITELERRLAANSEQVAAEVSEEIQPQVSTELDQSLPKATDTPAISELAEPSEDLESLGGSAELQPADSLSAASSTEPPPSSVVETARLDPVDPRPIKAEEDVEEDVEEPVVSTVEASANAPSTMLLQPPRLQSPPRPKYPAAARRLRRAATVQVRVLIDASGQVSETELLGPVAGFGFDSAAEAAAKRSRWTPATRDGEPVDSWALLTIEFQP